MTEPGVARRFGFRSSFRWQLAAVTAFALFWRVGYVWFFRRDTDFFGDAHSYHFGARYLADGEGYIDPLRFQFFGIRTPSAYHPPMYLTYLAAWTKLGMHTALRHRLVSCLLGAATVWFVGRLGHRLGEAARPGTGRTVGLISAGLAAVYPHLWLNDGALLSESAAGLSIVIAVLAALRYTRTNEPRDAAWFGLACGVATLGRAEMVLFLPLIAVPLLVRRWRRDGIVTALRHGAAVGLAALVVILPWVGYNLSRFEKPVYISTGLGATLTGGSCDTAFYGEKLGYWDNGTGCFAPQRQVVIDAPPGTAEYRAAAQRALASEGDESEREADARRFAFDYLDEHPGRWLGVVVPARIGRIWGVFRPWQTARFDGEIEGRGLAPARVALLSYYVLAALGIFGIVRLRRARVPIWPFVALVLIVTSSTALAFGVQRYRIPVDTVLPALAAVGLHAVFGRSSAPIVTEEADE